MITNTQNYTSLDYIIPDSTWIKYWVKLTYLLRRSLNPSVFIHDCGINSSSDSESCNSRNKLLQITEHMSMPLSCNDPAQCLSWSIECKKRKETICIQIIDEWSCMDNVLKDRDFTVVEIITTSFQWTWSINWEYHYNQDHRTHTQQSYYTQIITTQQTIPAHRRHNM
jgi:hypothetical protein